MKLRITHYAAAFALATVMPTVMLPAAAHAEVMVSRGGYCLDVNTGNGLVTIWACNGGGNQNFFNGSYGEVRFNNQCLTANGKGNQLHMAACVAGNKGQRWGLQGTGEFKNEEGYCTDIDGGVFQQGRKVQNWDCNGGNNQKFGRGSFQRSSNPAVASAPMGALFNPSGVRLGGAGIVAQGGGNIVAQGGGNIVAQGGGNVVVMSAGIVAQGGGN